MTRSELCLQLRENEQALSEQELSYIDTLKEAALAYIKSYTGINGVDSADENGRKLDDYEDLTFVLYALVSDMYDNRQIGVSKDKENPVVKALLGIHDFNLIPSESEESHERWSV